MRTAPLIALISATPHCQTSPILSEGKASVNWTKLKWQERDCVIISSEAFALEVSCFPFFFELRATPITWRYTASQKFGHTLWYLCCIISYIQHLSAVKLYNDRKWMRKFVQTFCHFCSWGEKVGAFVGSGRTNGANALPYGNVMKSWCSWLQ